MRMRRSADYVAAHERCTARTPHLEVFNMLDIWPRLLRHACRTPELACAADEDEAVGGTGAALHTVAERSAYLELMRAYASDTWSAQQAALQLRDNRGYDGYKQLTWHAAFRRLALVHALFKNFPDDSSTELPVATQVRACRAMLAANAYPHAVSFLQVMLSRESTQHL